MRHLPFFVLLVALAAPGAVGAQSSSTVTGVSRAMNPAISVNSLFWARISRDDNTPEFNKVGLQETEAQFTSVVDPFWQANVVLAVHPVHVHAEAEADAGDEDPHAVQQDGFELHVEEATLDGRFLPAGLALRLGKFFLPFGKHVPLHTHQFPFVNAPLAVSAFLGEHGLTEVGAQLTATVPVPWYSDLKAYAVDGEAEIFEGENTRLVFGGRLTNLWDLTENATVEIGASAFTGPGGGPAAEIGQLEQNGVGDQTVYGLDLTYKWVSAGRSQGPALSLTGEVILPRLEDSRAEPYGWYALTQYRLHRNWWLGATHGRVEPDLGQDHAHEKTQWEPGLAPGPAGAKHAHPTITQLWETKFNLTFAPSEFSALRVEIGWFDDRLDDDRDDLRFSVQWNFTIGSHPAHLY